MVIVYTGHGKGKTSACVGQAIRALGNGMSVAFAQFFKRDGVAGEQRVLRELLGDNFYATGLGFFTAEAQRPAHRAKALELLSWANARACQALVLDEVIYAINAGLALESELAPFFRRASDEGLILTLSGRDAPAWLVENHADIVTEMNCVKHAHGKGVLPAPGVEY